eukprot:7053891-Alexandrium_andersonii.AAC.1
MLPPGRDCPLCRCGRWLGLRWRLSVPAGAGRMVACEGFHEESRQLAAQRVWIGCVCCGVTVPRGPTVRNSNRR